MVTVNDITPTTPDKLTLTLTQGGVNKVLTRMWCVKCGFITYAKDADDKQSGINILAFERLELVGGNITCPRCDLSFLEVDYTDMAAVDTEPSPLKETLDPPPARDTAPKGMTTQELFERCEAIGGDFDDIKNKRSSRKDLHAFLLLAELERSNDKIVSGASHDEIEIGVSMETIEALNEFQILELVRCGVFFDAEEEYLGMSA